MTRAALILLALSLSAHATNSFDSLRDQIRRELAASQAPSLTVAVARNGRVIWEEGFGWADREHHLPANEHTIYALSSISKMFTATGLMTLVRAGKIDLDSPANDYLGDAKLIALAGDAQQATIRRLADHTSGLPPYYQLFYADEPYQPPPIDQTIRRYGILVRPPGEEVDYSNLGYGILGDIIARVSGQPYREFMRRQVFAKLGLDETSVGIFPGSDKSVAVAYGSDGKPLPRFIADPDAAMGIYSSAHDLIRFGMFLLDTPVDGQKRILRREQIAEMQKPSAKTGNDAGWGIGCGIVDLPSGYRVVSHNGILSGVSTTLRLIPSEKIAVVVLSNYNSGLPNAVADQILRALLPKFDGQTAVLDTFRFSTGDPMRPLYGDWAGKIHTYNGDLQFTLRFLPSGDIRAQIGHHLLTLLNLASWSDGQLRGEMYGELGTEDAGRWQYTISLNLKLRGNVLNGEVTALSIPGPRSGCALSYWVELKKL